jgi:phospholipase D
MKLVYYILALLLINNIVFAGNGSEEILPWPQKIDLAIKRKIIGGDGNEDIENIANHGGTPKKKRSLTKIIEYPATPPKKIKEILTLTDTTFKEFGPNSGWRTCFSSLHRCTPLITELLAEADSEIFIQAYYLTSEPITNSLIEAKNKGVDVTVIVDSSQATSPWSRVNELVAAEIPVFVDLTAGIHHNKIFTVDRKIVGTGSANFTAAAVSRNSENIIIIKDVSVATQYVDFFKNEYYHSGKYDEYLAYLAKKESGPSSPYVFKTSKFQTPTKPQPLIRDATLQPIRPLKLFD